MSAVLLPQGAVAGGAFEPRRASRETSPVAVSLPPGVTRPGQGRVPQPAATNRTAGLVVVIAVHVLLAWALASGMARDAIAIIKKPIQMAIIPDAPPPPPPPKVEKIKDIPKVQTPPPAFVPPPEVTPTVTPPAPVITAVQAEPPKQPVVIAAPPPPAPPAPEPKPAVVKQEISLACPGYKEVVASMLEEAIERVGITGTVRTRLTVRGNQVVDAAILSGPKEYAKYVQAAVKRMKCSAGGADEVQVPLDINFR